MRLIFEPQVLSLEFVDGSTTLRKVRSTLSVLMMLCYLVSDALRHTSFFFSRVAYFLCNINIRDGWMYPLSHDLGKYGEVVVYNGKEAPGPSRKRYTAAFESR